MFAIRLKDFGQGCFSLNSLKRFSGETGCSVFIPKTGVIIYGKFKSFCPDDKLCKPSCEQNENCYIKKPCGTLEGE